MRWPMATAPRGSEPIASTSPSNLTCVVPSARARKSQRECTIRPRTFPGATAGAPGGSTFSEKHVFTRIASCGCSVCSQRKSISRLLNGHGRWYSWCPYSSPPSVRKLCLIRLGFHSTFRLGSWKTAISLANGMGSSSSRLAISAVADMPPADLAA